MHIPSVPLSLLSTSPQDSLSSSVRPRDSTCPHTHPKSLCLSCPLVHGGRLHMSTHTYPQSLVHREREGTVQGTPHIHTHTPTVALSSLSTSPLGTGWDRPRDSTCPHTPSASLSVLSSNLQRTGENFPMDSTQPWRATVLSSLTSVSLRPLYSSPWGLAARSILVLP